MLNRNANDLISRKIVCSCGWHYGPNLNLQEGDRRLGRHRQRCDLLTLDHLAESDVIQAKERGYL